MEARSWDIVIVGGGTAGCVLANRLTADPRQRVLLLEAGPKDSNPWIHIPGGIFKLIHNPTVDWCYETEPDTGIAGRSLKWPCGKVLGGSSSINGMIYIRGQREDYDHWSALGNEGWSYDEVLPYFRRSERRAGGADLWHGVDGPLRVGNAGCQLEIVEAFIAAAQQAGLPLNEDFNGERQEGVGHYQLTADAGRRWSTARAFLQPAMSRSNLTVFTGALVDRLVLEGSRVVGVEYSRGGETYMARAGKEVILSAGAVSSPQILQRSGIGDPDELRSLGIEVKHALPGVGKNLQDHIQARVIYQTRRPITLNDRARTLFGRATIGAEYVLRRQGPLSFGASLAGAFARTDPLARSPDVQFHFQPLSLDKYDGTLHAFSGCTISVCQLRPESRGTIRLRSARPEEAPVIQPNYLQTPADRNAIVRGMRLLRRIARAPALASEIATEWKPGAEVESDDQIIDFVQSTGTTIFHPVGTCRMGHGADAVVDSRLRVHGLQGLRVADNSIMPTIVSGNTSAAAIMIGEKASDLVLERGEAMAASEATQ